MRIKKSYYLQCISLAVGAFILIYFVYSSGILDNPEIFFQMNLNLYILAIFLSFASIFLKIFRWKYLCRVYGNQLTFKMSSIITLSSLFFCNITPGKVGDLYKAYFMKKKYFMKYTKGVSMIFYERFFELFILVAVAASAIFLLTVDSTTMLVIEFTALILAVLIILFYKIDFLINISKKYLVKVPYVNIDHNEEISIQKINISQSASVFLITSFSLFFEFLRLWIVALAFGINLEFIELSIYFCLSILIGLVSQIPLGIGLMEGSLSIMIENMGVPSTTAIAIVMADRLISMYMVLIIGLVVSKLSLSELSGESGK